MSLSTVAEYAARQFEAQTITLGRPPLEPHQQPPAKLTDRSKNFWLLEGGRGCGKTEACSRYFSAYMRDNPGVRGRIIAPTIGDVIESCINGPSGLLAIDDQVRFLPSAPGGSKVKWPNGSEALLLGTYNPKDVDRLRASGNRHLDWWEEMAANRQLGHVDANGQLTGAWAQAQMGLRLGYFPHSIASTTPKTTPAYRMIRALDECIRVHATMYDNPYSSPEWRRKMEKDWGDTRVGRQEIHGILLEDVEGALWTLELLAHVTLTKPLPDLARIVTSYDPSGSEDGDATGIVTLGRDTTQVIYVLADDTTGGSPEHRAETACLAAARHGADEILYESNYGGDQIKAVLRSAWEHLVRTGKLEGPPPRLTANDAKGSKAQRAEPIAGLYEQHAAGTERIWHAQPFPQLVDELTTWEVDADWSPNRLDALVHGARHLTRRIGRRRESDRAQRAAETLRSSSITRPNGRAPLPTLTRRSR